MLRSVKSLWILMFLAAVLGWLSVDLSANSIAVNDPQWADVHGLSIYDVDNEAYIDRLRKSGVIALSDEEIAAIVEPTAQELTANGIPIPPFPTITGASRVDGEYQIHFRDDERGGFTVKIGEKLEEGWHLVSTDMKVVVATFEDEMRNINIVNYGDYSIPDDNYSEDLEP